MTQESDPLADIAFPEPIVSNPEVVSALIGRFSTMRPRRAPRGCADDRALRWACDYLGDWPECNVGLDELAAVAGIGKFRLIRLFRERTGLPPHALHRVRAARRLLEAGRTNRRDRLR